jgi:polyisoprenoid-binding protein YceI
VASPALLDALRHPVLGFRSTEIRRADEHLELDGGLTVKDRTLTVMALGTIEHEAGAERLRIELETTIDRRQFGLAWNAWHADGGWALGNEVRIHADLACTPDRAHRPMSTASPRAGRSNSFTR